MIAPGIAVLLLLSAACVDERRSKPEPAAEASGRPVPAAFLERLGRLRDAMCACKTLECAHTIAMEEGQLFRSIGDEPDDVKDEAAKIMDELSRCRNRPELR